MIKETNITEYYQFNELSEVAKERVVRNWDDTFFECLGSEINETLEAFCSEIGIKVESHSHYDSWFYTIRDYPQNWDDIGDFFNDITGVRTIKWFENNVLCAIRKGKYISKYSNGNYKSRYSKCTFETDNYNLTGVCYDNSILWPIISKEGQRNIIEQNLTPYEVVKLCLESFVTDIEKEIKYRRTEEFIREECEANEYKFDENGNII